MNVATIVPALPEPGDAIEPSDAGAPQVLCFVLAGMMSLITTFVMLTAVVFVPVMRYCRHMLGAVAGPAGSAAVV